MKPARTLTTTAAVFRDIPEHLLDLGLAVNKVAAQSGKSPARQYAEYLSARLGPTKLSRQEYYLFGLHRPQFDAFERGAFLGKSSYHYLNSLLSPDDRASHAGLLHDKIYFSQLMAASGFPMPRLQAHFSCKRSIKGVPQLSSAAEIKSFLQTKANFPVFGKPADRAYAVGTLSIDALADNGETAILGNGQALPLDALCRDLARTYANGYLFQDHLDQHRVASAACGRAIGALRIVTLMQHTGPEMLYALQRIPGDNAMSDAAHHSSRQNAGIDVRTGIVSHHFHADHTFGNPVETARYSNQPYIGQRLPFWAEITALVLDAHRMFPGAGAIGWDIALTKTGPVLVESSSKPYQLAWQLATGSGLLAPDFAAAFLNAILRSNRDIRRSGLNAGRCHRFLSHMRKQAQA